MAVLPFVNASGDPNTEYLSDGITESLINSLSQLPHLEGEVTRLRLSCTRARTRMPRRLGASWACERSSKVASRSAATTWKSARSWSTPETTDHIWGQQYSRKASDIFALQGDIAKEMTSALRMRLTGEDEKRMAKSYTANPEAYQVYLKGRFWWNKRSEEGYNKGIEYFRAGDRRKTPTTPWRIPVWPIATPHLAVNGFRAPNEVIPKAKEAALKALEIDDTLVEAHPSLAAH